MYLEQLIIDFYRVHVLTGLLSTNFYFIQWYFFILLVWDL